ncbi:hypothetical protein QM996_24720 (plasmid) [Sinorhizobium chiapasense]
MTSEPVNKYFGTPLSEWIERVPNELDMDAVGLWQVVETGRDGFELSGVDLRDFVLKCVQALLKSGAVPVFASTSSEKFWEKQLGYSDDADCAAREIVDEWTESGTDPDQDGLWFAKI